MLIIQNDPAGVTGRSRHAWDCNRSIQENIAAHLAHGGDAAVSINGELIDPRTDPRMDAPPRPGDFVTVTRRPAGLDPATWAYIALAALTVYTYASMPKPLRPADTTGKDSPNNALTAQTNIARAYQALPDVYGYRRVWPDLIQPSLVEYIDNVKFITEWLCVSRGAGDITDLQYADTAVDEFDSSSSTTFEPDVGPSEYPELNDTTLTDVLEPFAAPEVNGQELRYASATAETILRTGTFSYTLSDPTFFITFTDGAVFDYMKSVAATGGEVRIELFPWKPYQDWFPDTVTLAGYTESGSNVTFEFNNDGVVPIDESLSMTLSVGMLPDGAPSGSLIGPFILPVECDRIRWNTAFLRGLKGTAEIQVDWWQVDEFGAMISGTDEVQAVTYTADTYDQRFYTNEVTPGAGFGRYAIQFERTDVANADGSDVAKLEALYAIRHYPTKTLPGVTVLKVVTQAKAGSSGYTERRFNVRWQRHVRELDSATLSASRNFARSMAHLWCVAGEDIAEIDVDTLQAINDEHGEDSELLRFDGSLDDADVSLGERLQLIANAARCQLWRDGTMWTVTRDQARALPELQLDYRNLAEAGESTISYSAHLPATHDGVELEYVDEASQAKKAYVRLNISTGAVEDGACTNPLKIKLAGCTTEVQAENRAHLEARRLIYQRTSVQDTALADAGVLGIGSLVRWVDPNDYAGDDGLQAGEVMSIDGSVITTSEPLDWKGEATGRIAFTGIDGAPLGAAVTCTPAADGAVTLSSVPSGLYVRSASRQLGSRYAFSVGLSDAESDAAGLYVVNEITPAANRTVGLSLASYDDRMYSED